MKRIILILTLLFLVDGLQAQTKEETIAWLKDKVSKYGRNEETGSTLTYLNLYKIDGDKIVLERYLIGSSSQPDKYSSTNPYLFNVYKVNINDIIYSSLSIIKTNGLKISRWERRFGGDIQYDDYIGIQTLFFAYFNFDAEPDLESRFHKALDKLVEYNKVNMPKEVF